MEPDQLAEKGREYANQVVISSQCLSCGILFSETFAWYRQNEFNCPECGGAIDETPIVDYAQNAILRLKKIRENKGFPETPEES